MSLLAVDMGSSSCKAVAFSDDGTALAQATQSYAAAARCPSSWSEMPAENFWKALLTVTRAIAAAVAPEPVEALAISSHGETFVPVDSRHQRHQAGHPQRRQPCRQGRKLARRRNWTGTDLRNYGIVGTLDVSPAEDIVAAQTSARCFLSCSSLSDPPRLPPDSTRPAPIRRLLASLPLPGI